MFDTLDDAALLAEMSAAQWAERVAVARRLFAAGRLCQRRMSDVPDDQRTQWCIDNWEAVAGEVGAELGISRGRASSQMNYGIELLERLPQLGAVFAEGGVDFRVIAAAVFRTGLIIDPDVWARIDTELAARAHTWNGLSRNRLAATIDFWVTQLDPAALRAQSSADEDRHITFGEARNGMVEFWGSLRAGRALRHRPHGALAAGRPNACLQPGATLPRAPLTEDLLGRARTAGLKGNTATAPSCGHRHRGAATPPDPAVRSSSRNWPNRPAS